MIKHPEYRILSIPDTGQLFRPKLDSLLFDLSIPDNHNQSKIKIDTASNIPFHYEKINNQIQISNHETNTTSYIDEYFCSQQILDL